MAFEDDVVLKTLFGVQSVLAATLDNTPAALTVDEQRLVGRITDGNVAALTSAQVMAMLSGGAAATFNFGGQSLTGVGDVTLASGKWLGLAVDKGRLVFTDAATDTVAFMDCFVGIGVSPDYPLHIKSTTGSADIKVESTNAGSEASLRLEATNTGLSRIYFADEDDANIGRITYDHNTNAMIFRVGDVDRMTIDVAGNFGFGTADIEAWNAAYGVIEFPEAAIMWSETADVLYVLSNAYYDGAWKYKKAGKAAAHHVADGVHRFLVADTGAENGVITWTYALRMDSTGGFLIDSLAGVGNRAVIADATGLLSAP